MDTEEQTIIGESRGRWLRLIANLLMATGAALILLVGAMFAYVLWTEHELAPPSHEPNLPTPVPLRLEVRGEATAIPQPTSAKPEVTYTPAVSAKGVPPSPQAEPATPTATPTPRHWPRAVRLIIPRIEVDTPVVEVGWRMVVEGNSVRSEWETADNAAGHHITSANPGEAGNVVISGHNNIKGEVFRRLWELRPGDEVFLQAENGQEHRYVVSEAMLVREIGASQEQRRQHARYMDPTSDARVTLISCWPYWSNTHRVIVIGKLAPLTAEKK